MIGLGLIENIAEENILKFEDVDDSDGDGISGKANYSWDLQENKFKLGRFGWKASQPTVLQQTADAFYHDMGDGLSDQVPEFLAEGNEWRTPPLWGIGLTKIVSGRESYLHDGRAKTLEEAILWHGGESLESTNKFKELDINQRNQLLKFISSL